MGSKKWAQKFFAATMGCMMAFSAFACNAGEESDRKEIVVPESKQITMTEFDERVSLLPWNVSQYLAASSETLVTSYLLDSSVRCDKGEPVKVEYSFGDVDGANIVEEKLELSSKEDFSSIEQTLYFAPRRSYVNIYNLQTGATYYYRAAIFLPTPTGAVVPLRR